MLHWVPWWIWCEFLLRVGTGRGTFILPHSYRLRLISVLVVEVTRSFQARSPSKPSLACNHLEYKHVLNITSISECPFAFCTHNALINLIPLANKNTLESQAPPSLMTGSYILFSYSFVTYLCFSPRTVSQAYLVRHTMLTLWNSNMSFMHILYVISLFLRRQLMSCMVAVPSQRPSKRGFCHVQLQCVECSLLNIFHPYDLIRPFQTKVWPYQTKFRVVSDGYLMGSQWYFLLRERQDFERYPQDWIRFPRL